MSAEALVQLVKGSGMDIEDVGVSANNAWQRVPAVGLLVKRVASITVKGGRTDYAGAIIGPLEETPEQRRGVIGRTVAQACLGEEVDDLTPISDIGTVFDLRGGLNELSLEEEDEARDRLAQIVALAPEWEEILVTAPLVELSAAAARARPTVEVIHLLAGLRSSQEALDDDAAVFAPTVLLVERKTGVRREELPDSVPRGSLAARGEHFDHRGGRQPGTPSLGGPIRSLGSGPWTPPWPGTAERGRCHRFVYVDGDGLPANCPEPTVASGWRRDGQGRGYVVDGPCTARFAALGPP